MVDIEQQVWGMTTEGEVVVLYTITNSHGEWVRLTNLGAAVVGLGVRGHSNSIDNVVLGYDQWTAYQGDDAAMGKTIGRFANRIARGRFSVGGHQYQLPINSRPNHLHGGAEGFQNKIWQARVEVDRVVFSYVSPANEGGYPGEVGVECVYDWDDEAALEITFFGGVDSPTIVNLTNHCYFNLAGAFSGAVSSSAQSSQTQQSSQFSPLSQSDICRTILDHKLQVFSDRYLEMDNTGIPTGKILTVEGTVYDFRESTEIGTRIEDQVLVGTHGYDMCFDVRCEARTTAPLSSLSTSSDECQMRKVAVLACKAAGRKVEIFTSQPGLQLYTGNYLDGTVAGTLSDENTIDSDSINIIAKKVYCDYAGVALECQGFPDAPNHPEFPSVVVNAGELYEQHIIYKFSLTNQ